MSAPLKIDKSDLPKAIFVMGPTASGKTDLAIELSKHLPCDLISVDSALVYKDMDIGSAKPDVETLEQYPHRLIDIRDPAEPYSGADFRRDALDEMASISEKGRIPLLVGGTMMYFKLLLEGISDLPPANPEVRAAIDVDALEHGWPYVHQQLAEVDPESAARIHPTDPQRLQRALEVFRVSGVTMTQWRIREQEQKQMQQAQGEHQLPYNVCQIAIGPVNRAILHERIAKRFRIMVEQGFVDEVQQLKERGDLHLELPSMRAVGYRQIWEYLEGELTYDEMIERGIIATRQLAKRQCTWLRGWPELHWIETDSAEGGGLLTQEEITQQALNIIG